MTSFTERTKASLREALLDAATELLPDRGYAALRMADVAARAGVSRQTVYNEFGSKAALTQAVTLRTTSEFLDGIRQRFDEADGLLAGIRCAVTFTIEHGRRNRLVAAALGTDAGEDLLPLLTTKGEPILTAATELAAGQYRELEPTLSEDQAALLAEAVVRLSLSHLVLRTHSAVEAADTVCAVMAPAIASFTDQSTDSSNSSADLSTME
ncbi:TetR/AcrR family transcriptional regulator [Amycolatopsis sp. H20-H5]|uniref:TetR/AcrR family transcriptional regulator n=1 Tax=Amycolatopsis sp. H20-H5 TaxID=3046309 RepID=UPI002DBCB10E|nr:TetR family transcriptional regulator [Amycolatopsis sp. H20-H5]MEC3978586.1 TetR family transcriptional regulator [Amycolatopsis sp. H20-H5]